MDSWKKAFAAYEYNKQVLTAFKQHFIEVDNLLSTLLQVFILKMCTTVYREILINQNP